MRGPTQQRRRELDREEAEERRREDERRAQRPRDPRLGRNYVFERQNQGRRLSEREADSIISELTSAFARLREATSLLMRRRRVNDAFDDLMATVLSSLTSRFAEEVTAIIFNATQRSIQLLHDERPV